MIHSVDKQQTSQTFPVVRKEVLAVKYFDCLCGRCITEKLSFSVECSGLQEIVGLTVPVSKVSNRTVKSEPVYSPAFTISGSKLAIDGTTTAIDASATSDVTAWKVVKVLPVCLFRNNLQAVSPKCDKSILMTSAPLFR